MFNYSKLLAIMLCLQPTLSVSMSFESGSQMSVPVAFLSYSAFLVSHYFKQDHEIRNRSLLRGEVDKETAKVLMNTSEAQQLIKNLQTDQANRRQQFFLANNRPIARDILIKAGFAKMLQDKYLFDHASRIISFLSLSETALDAQLIQIDEIQTFGRAGLRHRIVDEATQKARAEHAKHTKITRYFFVAACTAGSTALCLS